MINWKQFLVSFALIALPVGGCTVLVWLNSKRKLSFETSYHRAILHLIRFVAWAFVVISGVILAFALSDQAGLSHFGYPAYSVPVIGVFMIIGYGIQSFAARWLRFDQLSN